MIVALAHYSERPGANPYVWRLGCALKDLGHDVRPLPASALFMFHGGAAWAASTIHIQWFESHIGSSNGLKMLGKSLLFLAQLRLCRLLGKRLVWTLHNAESHEVSNPRIEPWAVRQIAATVDRIFVHCEDVIPGLIRRLQLPNEDKMQVIRHGNYIGLYPDEISRDEARRHLELDEGDFVFLFLGNIRPYKGIDELLAAFGGIRSKSVKLLIAGRPHSDNMRMDVESRISRQPNVIFKPNFIADDEIQVYMRACDVVVFPYRKILASGAIVLATSFGKPCLAPRIGCIPALIDESSNFLYALPTAENLPGAMQSALQNNDKLERMGSENFARAGALDWASIAAATARHYR